jgi:hypothetical protein
MRPRGIPREIQPLRQPDLRHKEEDRHCRQSAAGPRPRRHRTAPRVQPSLRPQEARPGAPIDDAQAQPARQADLRLSAASRVAAVTAFSPARISAAIAAPSAQRAQFKPLDGGTDHASTLGAGSLYLQPRTPLDTASGPRRMMLTSLSRQAAPTFGAPRLGSEQKQRKVWAEAPCSDAEADEDRAGLRRPASERLANLFACRSRVLPGAGRMPGAEARQDASIRQKIGVRTSGTQVRTP